MKIAVAKDAAFNFYYQENFELLEALWCRDRLFFSVSRMNSLPEHIDGLYIGGGFPEEFAEELSAESHSKDYRSNMRLRKVCQRLLNAVVLCI